jgi:hypothetical protein
VLLTFIYFTFYLPPPFSSAHQFCSHPLGDRCPSPLRYPTRKRCPIAGPSSRSLLQRPLGACFAALRWRGAGPIGGWPLRPSPHHLLALQLQEARQLVAGRVAPFLGPWLTQVARLRVALGEHAPLPWRYGGP